MIQTHLMLVERQAAAASSALMVDVYEISTELVSIMQQLNDKESPDKTDEWMRFSCWQSFEKAWGDSNLYPSHDVELFAKVDDFVKLEAASYQLVHDHKLYEGVAVDARSLAPVTLSSLSGKTVESVTHELYPHSIAIFGAENMQSVQQLASLGLSDYEIDQHIGGHSVPQASNGSATTAVDVAFDVSGVDLTDAREKLRMIESNFQGVLYRDSKAFNEWIRSPVPPKKVVCRVEGTDDVMLLHVLLSKCQNGFVRNAVKDSMWSDFTYAHAAGKELRLCAEKLSLEHFGGGWLHM